MSAGRPTPPEARHLSDLVDEMTLSASREHDVCRFCIAPAELACPLCDAPVCRDDTVVHAGLEICPDCAT